MGVATKPLIAVTCESCQRELAFFEVTMPDGSKFKVCQRCVTPVPGGSTRMIMPGRL